uniref:lipopolysaccharide heptosyltransferase II n=1 Tax=Desulfobacca acetoxidans TaxID=60893 RepID=A0A7V4G937_9BACT
MTAMSAPRLLLIKLSSLGDVIHALPTLEALRELYPRGHITWLVEEGNAPLLLGHPALDEVWTAPRPRWGTTGLGRAVGKMLTLARRFRETSFDVVIDLQGLLKSAGWTALAKSPRKIGYHRTREWSYLPLSERLPPYDPETHAVWRYLNIARYLGAPTGPPRFRLGLQVPENLEHLLPPDQGRGLVILHPGARWPTKLWSVAGWAALAAWLSREAGLQVALTGSPADLALAAAIAAQAGTPVINLAGRTTLAELAALLLRARLAVTVDTGPMHLAAALGTPVAALFGPTAPWRTGPFGEGHEVVRLDLPCSPCFRRECPAPRCLTELPEALVRRAVEKILQRGGKPC